MRWQFNDNVHKQCYPSGSNKIFRIAGFVLIGAGGLLLLFCVPYWAWMAILAAALILIGIILIKK